jgi:hypothetical protein
MSRKDVKKNTWPFPQESGKCSDKKTSWRYDKASTACKIEEEADGVFYRPSKERIERPFCEGRWKCGPNTKLL